MTEEEKATQSKPPRSPKAEEGVKFEADAKKVGEDESINTKSQKDGSVVSQNYPTSIDGTASSWAPRTMDAASASMTSVRSPQRNKDSAKTKKQKQAQYSKQTSLPERLGNSALSSTLGILKLAGDVTLSTTGTILSPSLEMTKNVILPNLLAGVVDYLGQISPQRLKDWFRILSASIHHIVAVIVATERGSVFRHKILRVGGDVVDVVSSDNSRQALMDGMACFVKLTEALHTPEFKAFLEQASVLGCRVVDVAAMGKNKKLLHDLFDLVWSGIELVNDPATTVAFAEVAAYLCHALEMEDAAIHAIAKQREEINRTAAEKRHERDQYQAATYQESYLFRDPNATVEEVILSAFGVIQKSVEEAKIRNGQVDTDDIPGSVVLGSEDGGESERPSRAVTPTPPEASTKGGVAETNVDYEDVPKPSDEEPFGIESNDIDVKYLREKITKRAEDTNKGYIESRRSLNPMDLRKLASHPQLSAISDGIDDGKKDIEELASLPREDATRQKHPTALHFEESETGPEGDKAEWPNETATTSAATRQDRSKPLEGETPVAHFYRVLDEVLSEERQKAAGTVLKRTGSSSFEGGDGDLSSTALKRHVQGHRSEKRRSAKGSGIHPAIEKLIKDNEMLVCGMVFGALGLGLLFFLFGCYGVYMFVFPPTVTQVVAAVEGASPAGIHVPLVIHGNQNEYVIKVVREVVHLDSKGKTMRIERDTKHTDEL